MTNQNFRAATPNEVQLVGAAFEKGKYEELCSSDHYDEYGGAILIEYDKYYIVAFGSQLAMDESDIPAFYVVSHSTATDDSDDLWPNFRAWLRELTN